MGGSEDADAGPSPPVAELWDTTSTAANPQRQGQTKPVPIPAVSTGPLPKANHDMRTLVHKPLTPAAVIHFT